MITYKKAGNQARVFHLGLLIFQSELLHAQSNAAPSKALLQHIVSEPAARFDIEPLQANGNYREFSTGFAAAL